MAAKKKATAKKKAASKKTTSKKATAKKTAAKKTAAKKTAAKKTAAKKTTAKKTASKKAAAKKSSPKKAAAKKSTTKKPATKKAAAKKPSRSKKGLAAAGSAAESLGFTPYQQKKSEEYMSEPMKQHFREILAAWKRELMEEVDRTVHHMQDEAANFPDPSDRATQESEFSLELRTRDRERKLIRKIDSTFKLIDADEYGWCDTCGIEIGIRRLEARPTASQCIDCKTLDEIREKQMMN